jgi:hypothetical protein
VRSLPKADTPLTAVAYAPLPSTTHAHSNLPQSNTSNDHPDRNPDGTFTKGSDLAKELGAQGGHASHGSSEVTFFPSFSPTRG